MFLPNIFLPNPRLVWAFFSVAKCQQNHKDLEKATILKELRDSLEILENQAMLVPRSHRAVTLKMWSLDQHPAWPRSVLEMQTLRATQTSWIWDSGGRTQQSMD